MNVRQLFNRWVILGALGFAGLLLLITAISLSRAGTPQNAEIGFAPADVTVIAAPTSTSGAPPTPTIDPTATTLAMRVEGESSSVVLNTSASGSDFMFSWPPRQEAHGQAARNNPNG